MGWFRRTPARGPVDDLCDLLAGRPDEWGPDPATADEDDFHSIEHPSGLKVMWADREYPSEVVRVWVAPAGREWVLLDARDAERVLRAVLAGGVNAARWYEADRLPWAGEVGAHAPEGV